MAHEAERLGASGVQDLPRADVQGVAQLRQFVGQTDVDEAESVLEDLGGLGHFGTRYRVHPHPQLRVETGGQVSASGRQAADDLGYVQDGVAAVARVQSLGGERQAEVRSYLSSPRFE